MRRFQLASASIIALSVASAGSAQDSMPNLGQFGDPGLLDMPTARTAEAGTIATHLVTRGRHANAMTSYFCRRRRCHVTLV